MVAFTTFERCVVTTQGRACLNLTQACILACMPNDSWRHVQADETLLQHPCGPPYACKHRHICAPWQHAQHTGADAAGLQVTHTRKCAYV
jgi:hypothetical protein